MLPELEHLLSEDLATLMKRAAAIRDEAFGTRVTFSKKVFIPLTHLCRDNCGYCTFVHPPKKGEAAYLSPEQVLEIARAGQAAGCAEALFTLGDKPELKWKPAAEALEAMGYATTLDYLAAMGALVFKETGLLPHFNPGLMDAADLAKLRKALDLKDDATEDAIATALTSHAAMVTAYAALLSAAGLKADAAPAELLAQVTTHAADAGKLTAISAHFTKAGLDLAKLTPSELETHLQAKGGDAAELRRTVISLQSQLTTLQAEGAKEKAVAFIDGAIAAGKPLLPMRDHYVARHQKDPAGVEKEVGALPSIHDGGVKRPPPEGALVTGATTAEIMAAADKHQAEQARNGNPISSTDAILHVTGRR